MDLMKVIAVICTVIGTVIAAYRFFWKAPSEKIVEVKANELEVNEREFVINEDIESIARRFIALFESHAVHRNQIPEFFGHGLDHYSCASDVELLKKLTPEMLADAVNLFGVSKDWLECSSEQIYNIPDFYQEPWLFDNHLQALGSSYKCERMMVYVLKANRMSSNSGYDALFVIAEPIGEINGRNVYKYHLLGQWANRYWKSRAYFTACCALLYKHGFLVCGYYVESDWLSQVIFGQQLLDYDFNGVAGGLTFPSTGTWRVADFVEIPDEYLAGMDTEQGRAVSLALEKWLSLSESGFMRCFPKHESAHKSVENSFRKKLAEL